MQKNSEKSGFSSGGLPNILGISIFIFSAAALLLGGCKGGTDLNGLRFRGTLGASSDAHPLEGVLVTVAETGESDMTDRNGFFDIRSSTFASNVSIQLHGASFEDTVSVGAIPDTAEIVEVALVLDVVTRKVSAASIHIFPDSADGPAPDTTVTTLGPGEPTPSPTSAPGAPGVTTTTVKGRPTPTPTHAGPFDSNGNTSSFGIPGGLKGNISRGAGVWSGTCQACHSHTKRGASYDTVRGALGSIPQMRDVHESSQQIADVVAFLNK